MHSRTVFFVSDGTGITAETFGNAILAQFEFNPRLFGFLAEHDQSPLPAYRLLEIFGDAKH